MSEQSTIQNKNSIRFKL